MSVSSPAQIPEPVTAEIVPPAPSPWRFGLKALLGLMVVCSVQFALMNYLGVLGGLGIGLAVVALAFAAILVGGMVLSGRQARHLPTLDVVIVRIMVATLVLVFGTIMAGGGTAMYHTLVRVRNEQLLERSLGMELSKVQVNDNNNIVWGLRITSVEDGGVAHQAGLVQDEVIIVDGTVDQYLDRLQANRGKAIDVNVAVGALNQSLQNCQQRSVTLDIPN